MELVKGKNDRGERENQNGCYGKMGNDYPSQKNEK